MEEDQSLYNQITVQNVDDEDFVFKVQREQYMIAAGEIRIFPKFMVRPLVKHLIDKILIKREPSGKYLRNQTMRDELAAQIVLHEESFQKPILPTDRELVEKMNSEPELDKVLKKLQTGLKKVETQGGASGAIVSTNVEIETPKVDTSKVTTQKPKVDTAKIETPKVVETQSTPVSEVEKFDQIEEEKNPEIPTREKMMQYAKNVLKLDIEEPKTRKIWDKMTNKELFVELGLDKEEDLESLIK